MIGVMSTVMIFAEEHPLPAGVSWVVSAHRTRVTRFHVAPERCLVVRAGSLSIGVISASWATAVGGGAGHYRKGGRRARRNGNAREAQRPHVLDFLLGQRERDSVVADRDGVGLALAEHEGDPYCGEG